MNLHPCFLTHNDCYKAGKTIIPRGIVVHSTGAYNPYLKRYVQPDDGILGKNVNGNDWNRSGVRKCVHAFIGLTDDGTIATYQTLPWRMRCWGCGSGKKGSYNNGYIQFEICEDALTDKNYFEATYREAVELCVFLCEQYSINVSNIVSHHEAGKAGYASWHSDTTHWWSKFNRTMDDFRTDVLKELEGDEIVKQADFDAMMETWLANRAKEDPAAWSAAARNYVENAGIIKGDASGAKRYKSFITREEMAQVLFNLMGDDGK